MKTRFFSVVIALFLCAISLTVAQQPARVTVPLSITNGRSTVADTFGIASGATFGVDRSLGEQDMPPFPAGNLYALFRDEPGLGTQSLQLNYHPGSISAPSTPDSFYLHFQRAADSSVTVFHWNHAFLAQYLNGCTLVDNVTYSQNTDMLAVDSMVIPAGQPSRTNKVYFDWVIFADWKPLQGSSGNPPSAYAGSAISITATSAVIVGSVYSSTGSATAHFEWGTSTDYGNSTPDIWVSSASGAATVSAALTNLSPGAGYYFRVVATNDYGTSYSDPVAFNTTNTVSSQRVTIPITLRNFTSTMSDTFGIANGATFGVDPALGEQDEPPAPPAGVLWAVFQGEPALGQRSLRLNYHPGSLTAQSTPDSFYIHFQRASDTSVTVFSWDRAFLAQHVNSCLLVDINWSSNPIDMLAVDSMIVPAGQPSRTNKVYFDWAILPDWKQLPEINGNTPIVWTQGATNITRNSASISGQVSSPAGSATAHFEWGTSTDYGHSTPDILVGSASSAVTITAALSSLLPNTGYYYRIVATNFYGASYGDPASFTTTGSPAGPQATIPIIMRNFSSTIIDTFGIAGNATKCIDQELGEYELPPMPPTGVASLRFIENQCLGNGVAVDFHPGSVTVPATPDTFLFNFQREVDTARTVFYWDRAQLARYANSCMMMDNVAYFDSLDMLAVDSLVIPGGTQSVRNHIFLTWAIYVSWKPLSPDSGNRPSVWTDNAGNITLTSADLVGRVLPNAQSATAHFEWGTTPSYGFATQSIFVGSASTPVTLSTTLPNLAANTDYYYRLVASNASGTTYGSRAKFTTAGEARNGQTIIPITIQNSTASITDIFGIATNATACIDTALGEAELPPIPPQGVLDFRFVEYPCEGQGLNIDFHPGSPSIESTQDTFIFHIQRMNDNLTTVVRWNSTLLARHLHSCILADNVGFTISVDMLATDSLVIPAGQPSYTNHVYFYWAIYADWKPVDTNPVYSEDAPNIFLVKDVPNDQGGKVTVAWNASQLDNSAVTLPFYSIWRSIPIDNAVSAAAIAAPHITANFSGAARRTTMVNGTLYAWEWIGNMPAHSFAQYSFTAPTLYDSMANTNGKHYFLVSAHTDNPELFYDSNVDSGYSVDNIPPAPPRVIHIILEGSVVSIKWFANNEPDLRRYVVYRGPNADNLSPIGQTADTFYVDPAPSALNHIYTVKAEDVHGNLSGPGMVLINGVNGENTMLPTAYGLEQNYPNPFNPTTTIRYSLPQSGHVVLKVYNMLGEEVATLVNGAQSAGYQTVTFEVTNIPSGVYIYRLNAGSYTETKKMILMR